MTLIHIMRNSDWLLLGRVCELEIQLLTMQGDFFIMPWVDSEEPEHVDFAGSGAQGFFDLHFNQL